MRPPALRVLPLALAVAPLVVLTGQLDFARLPQQAFVQLLALVLGLLWAGGKDWASARADRRAFDAPLAVFVTWSALSLLGARDTAPGLGVLGHWAACGVVYLLVSRAAGPGDVPRLTGGLLLGGAVASAVGLGQALVGLDWVPQAAAPAATLANRNVAAAYAATVAPLALAPWPGRRARAAAALAAGTMLTFLPFARSRAALLAVAVQLTLMALAFSTPRVPARRGGLVVPAAAIASSLALVSGAAWLSLADPQKGQSLSVRWSLARGAASMAAEHPLRGVGLGGFAAHYASHGPALPSPQGVHYRVDSPHDEPLQILAETGGPGLAAAIWVALAAVAALRRLRASPEPAVRRAALALGLSLAGLAVDASFGFPLRYPLPPLVLAVLLGLLAALDAAPSPARVADRLPVASRLARLGASSALVTATGLAFVSSSARLQQDRAAFRAAFLPVVHAQPRAGGSCGAGVVLDRAADGRLDLSARAVPLAELLQCLVERTGLRVEYDGPAPRQAVSVALRGEPLDRTLEALLEGLGVNYLLTRDASGHDRLIVFGASGVAEPSRGAASRAPADARRPEPVALPEPAFEEEEEEPQPASPASPQPFPPPAGPPGPEPSGAPFPVEEDPAVPEPQELTPLTLQLGRRTGSAVASTAGNSPVR